jgi:hypothetical protein
MKHLYAKQATINKQIIFLMVSIGIWTSNLWIYRSTCNTGFEDVIKTTIYMWRRRKGVKLRFNCMWCHLWLFPFSDYQIKVLMYSQCPISEQVGLSNGCFSLKPDFDNRTTKIYSISGPDISHSRNKDGHHIWYPNSNLSGYCHFPVIRHPVIGHWL